MNVVKQWLFFDRADIYTGASAYSFDAERLTDEGKKEVDALIHYWHFHARLGETQFGSVKAPFGVRFKAEKARLTDKIFPMEHPWEQGMMGWVSGAYDPEDRLYKLWYTMHLGVRPELNWTDGKAYSECDCTLYAYSYDGVEWIKPQLDVLTWEGHKTNAVGIPIGEGTVFLDRLHPETGRFKAVTAYTSKDESIEIKNRVYLALYASDDGIHWHEITDHPLRYFFDTQNNIFFDEILGKYVGYLRGHFYGRAIQRTEGDAPTRLPMPDMLLYPDNEDALDVDYYNNCATVYPHDPSIRLLFPSIYAHGSDLIDMRMAVSRNGYQYHWVSREPVVGNTDESGSVLNHVYAGPHLLPMGEFVGLLMRTINLCHNESYFVNAYKDDYGIDCGVRMALWQKDRLACLCAEEVGEFYLNAHVPADGCMEINCLSVGQGCVRAAVYPVNDDHPYPGFELEACTPLRGDCPWSVCRWNGDASLIALADKDVHIRFRLDHARIYGCRMISYIDEAQDQSDGLSRTVSAL